jgi:flagellar basal body rod protein FlgG
MIDINCSSAMDRFNDRAADALGYGTPGYQPKFHDVLSSQVRSIKTFDPLSVVAPKNTYFVVDNGDGSRSYTRGGDFRLAEGQLVDREGRTVLGYPNGIEKGTLAPITLPPGTPDGRVRIASDGTVSYLGSATTLEPANGLARRSEFAPGQNGVIDPTTAFDSSEADALKTGLKQGLTPTPGLALPVGKLALARFATGTIVSNAGRATSGPPIEMGPPKSGEIGALKTGYRDVSSVDHTAMFYHLTEANALMNAMYSACNATHNINKQAMELIK